MLLSRLIWIRVMSDTYISLLIYFAGFRLTTSICMFIITAARDNAILKTIISSHAINLLKVNKTTLDNLTEGDF